MANKAVVLLSGGLDSTTALAVAKNRNYQCSALIFDYTQRHRIEIEYAQKQCDLNNIDHKIIHTDFGQFGGSALTDPTLEVPTDRNLDQMTEEIPITYVPGRNTIFLSYALSYAETIGANAIFTGVNALDYSGYPDCRPEYIEKYQELANLSSKAGVEGRRITINAPLIDLTKVEIIELGTKLGVDYSLTSSCYNPTDEGLACGVCDSCILRKEGFKEAGIPDPTKYAPIKSKEERLLPADSLPGQQSLLDAIESFLEHVEEFRQAIKND